MKKLVFIFLLLFLNSYLIASDINIEGLIFGNYSLYISDYKKNGSKANDYNTFDIGRIYFGSYNKHNDSIFSKVTLEANTLSNGNNVFLKLAYVEYKKDNLSMKFGLMPSLWIGWEENNWKYVFVDFTQMHSNKILYPSDKGFSLMIEPKKSFKVEASISNGEGFNTIENSKKKDIQIKLTKELNNFRFSAFSLNSIGGKERDRYAVGGYYKYSKFSIGFSAFHSLDYSTTTYTIKKDGFSLYFDYNFYDKYSFFSRVDFINPDIKKSNDNFNYYIVGISKKIEDYFLVAVSYKSLVNDKQTAILKNEDLISTNFYIKF